MELSPELAGVLADIDMEFSDVMLTGKTVEKIVIGKELADALAASPGWDNTIIGFPVEVSPDLPGMDHQFISCCVVLGVGEESFPKLFQNSGFNY